MDGWSVPVLVQELLALYARRGCSGAAVDAPNAIIWRGWPGRTARRRWRPGGISGGIGGRPGWRRPCRARAGACGALTLALSAEQSAALSRQARQRGLTLNTFIQAAWAVLLGRLTGRDDVVFGVTVAGRPPELAGIERMVGLFINTLPLRIRLPARQPLIELLKEVQDSQSRLMAQQHLGLAEIQGLAGLGELFDTLVVFENYPVDRAGLASDAGGLRISELSGADATHYPLSLAASPGERLQLRLCYRPDLFERASVEAIADRLTRLLEAAVAQPDRPIGSLDILAPAERHRILREWNDTARAVPRATLPALFAAQVARTPDAVAALFEQHSLSYRALDARSSQLAHHLRAHGVGPEVVVGLCIERSLEMLIGLLGILKAGGAYLPLDPDYPAERLAFMLADARAPLLVTTAALRARLPATDARVVCLDAEADSIAALPTSAPANNTPPAQPRLCHLHFRLNRHTKRRRGHAQRDSKSSPNAHAQFRADRICTGPAVCFTQLRCSNMGDHRRIELRGMSRASHSSGSCRRRAGQFRA